MKRKLAAVWFADVVGYTSVSAEDEAGALELVSILQEVADRVVTERDGRVVKFIGDAAMTEFGSAEAAVDAALELVEEFRARVRSGSRDAELRVGVHLGELSAAEDGDIYGDVVNTAARLQGHAEPGTALVSEDVWRQLRRRPTLSFEERGARALKGKEEPVRTFEVTRRYDRHAQAAAPPHDPTDRRRRLVVLPFESLRADPDVDFLAFGLPDAVSSSLMGVNFLVVRSPLKQPGGGERPDPREAAREAGADLVLSGSIQRAGTQVRVIAQLTDGRHGTLLWNATSTRELGDLFEVQDDLTRRIVDSLAEPLTFEERESVSRDVPASGKAYSLYLRANETSVRGRDWAGGIRLYREALAEDSAFAPAWARLGRCHRLLAKYGDDPGEAATHEREAEEAFRRALELNPELPLAHSLLAQFEVETGRPIEGLRRLLGRAAKHRSEVDLFIGLTHACRYCGLSAASLASHERAVALDPLVLTSVAYTHLQTGDFEGALAAAPRSDPSHFYALQSLGRAEAARSLYDELSGQAAFERLRAFADAVLATMAGERERALGRGRDAIEGFPDAEGRYFIARCWSALGAREDALEVLEKVVEDGLYCVDGLRGDPMFDPLRETPDFGALLERCDAARAAAVEAFLQEGGGALLGLDEAALALGPAGRPEPYPTQRSQPADRTVDASGRRE